MQKYNSKTLGTIAFIYGFTLFGVFMFPLYPIYGSNPRLKKWLADLDIWCPVKCKSDSCKTYVGKTRGKKYTPTNDQNPTKSCAMTFWHVTHFVLYFILSYLFPSFYVEFFVICVLWEFIEYFTFECQDVSDLFFNSTGILTGIAVSKMWKS
jgi:hypothetical protein